MSVNTKGYYEYRSRQARDMGAAAVDPTIAAIHMEMAKRYELLASSTPQVPTSKPKLRIVTR